MAIATGRGRPGSFPLGVDKIGASGARAHVHVGVAAGHIGMDLGVHANAIDPDRPFPMLGHEPVRSYGGLDCKQPHGVVTPCERGVRTSEGRKGNAGGRGNGTGGRCGSEAAGRRKRDDDAARIVLFHPDLGKTEHRIVGRNAPRPLDMVGLSMFLVKAMWPSLR